MLNILYMGTPDFAKVSLEAVYNAGYNIIGTVTNPDKPKGRGMKMISSPVKEFAIEKDIPIYQPLKVKNNTEFIEKIKSLNPDVICVVAYGKILPKEIKFIPSIELTCKDEGVKCHILGYNCDCNNEKLLDLVLRGKELRRIKLETRIKYLKDVWSIELTQDELDTILNAYTMTQPGISGKELIK